MTDDEIIDAYMNAVCDGGTPVATCDFCQRTWFQAEGDSMEEGELERLQQKQKTQPLRYLPETVASSVGFGYAFGRQTIWRCRCAQVRSHVLTLWNHRFRVCAFYADLAAQMTKEAAQTKAAVQSTGTEVPDE